MNSRVIDFRDIFNKWMESEVAIQILDDEIDTDKVPHDF